MWENKKMIQQMTWKERFLTNTVVPSSCAAIFCLVLSFPCWSTIVKNRNFKIWKQSKTVSEIFYKAKKMVVPPMEEFSPLLHADAFLSMSARRWIGDAFKKEHERIGQKVMIFLCSPSSIQPFIFPKDYDGVERTFIGENEYEIPFSKHHTGSPPVSPTHLRSPLRPQQENFMFSGVNGPHSPNSMRMPGSPHGKKFFKTLRL